MKLYAARNKNTGELVNISNSKIKFFHRKGSCRNTIDKYNRNKIFSETSYNLELVEFDLIEVNSYEV